jgi:hypothetical protein
MVNFNRRTTVSVVMVSAADKLVDVDLLREKTLFHG